MVTLQLSEHVSLDTTGCSELSTHLKTQVSPDSQLIDKDFTFVSIKKTKIHGASSESFQLYLKCHGGRNPNRQSSPLPVLAASVIRLAFPTCLSKHT